MSDWRDYLLQHFQIPSHRLTLVADPDGLMLEERLLAALRASGFQLLRFDDAVRFRYAFETQFRQRWDRNEETELVVVLRSPEHDLHHLPFDLLQVGRQLKFQLSDLFPKLSYPIVCELDRADFDLLYAAYQNYTSDELGDQGTRAYLLRHVFGVSAETLRTPAEVLKHLLARHYTGRRVPASLDRFLLERLQKIPGTEHWPLAALLSDRNAFFNFLQQAWPRFLIEREAGITGVRESRISYGADAPLLPLDEPEVRAFVDSLFLEGYLRPIPVPIHWRRDSWTEVGVVRQPEIDRQLRFERLIEAIRQELPGAAATHQAWIKFARTWAEVIVLRYGLPADSPLPAAVGFEQLQLIVEQRFADWMQQRYLTLHNYPSLPAPVMLHQVPHYLANQLQAKKFHRVALIVIDGLALDQWLTIQGQLCADNNNWNFAEDAVFAWVPTLTSVSRQSIFAAWPPLNFPKTWTRTDREPNQWKRFWIDEGLSEHEVRYFNGADLDADPELDEWLHDPRAKVAGLVLRKVDDIMHGVQLGTAGMHRDVDLWAEQGHLAHLLRKLQQVGFAIFITADHGNITARGIDRPQQGDLIESRGKRALQFSQPGFLAQAQAQFPTAIAWHSEALPDSVYVLLADGLNAFESPAEEIVCHGGISLEEVIVPFVQVTGVPA